MKWHWDFTKLVSGVNVDADEAYALTTLGGVIENGNIARIEFRAWARRWWQGVVQEDRH